MGHQATSPTRMSWAAWWQVIRRTFKEAGDDNAGLIAAGVAFYGFLALIPVLGSTVLIYGLVADPTTVAHDIARMAHVLPQQAAQLIGQQLDNIVQTSAGKKGAGLLVSLAISLFGARNGAGAVISALNIAYEEEERRSLLRINLLALLMTLGAILAAILAVLAIAAMGALDSLFPQLPGAIRGLGKLVSYIVLGLGGATAAALLYRYGPDRDEPQWQWLTPGSLATAVAWMLLTLLFGIYVRNFGSYDATYGSLSAVIVLLTWMYLSAYILILGAELNSEFEFQTARDTTEGRPRPMGERGATAADHVAEGPGGEGRREASGQDGAGPDPRQGSARGTAGSSDSSGGRPSPRPAGRAPGSAHLLTTRATGGGEAGWLPAILAGLGLRRLASGGGRAVGAALLAGAGLIALLRRDG